ncbi:MAG: ketopantoate reductase family protein [Christensenellales bacterium]|jgi:2-dehydropantoate 2-reductase
MTYNKIAIIGLGAVGCAYAHLIQKAGFDLKVIAGGERAQRISSGIRINGDTVVFDTIAPGEEYEADLLLVACKFHHLDQVIADMKACVGKDTVIVSLLNGLGAEERLQAAYPKNAVLYCRVAGISALKDGNELSIGGYGYWKAGAADNRVISPPVSALISFCEEIGLPLIVPEDMLHAVWWKLMCNVGINQCSAVLRAPYGVFQKIPEARNMMLAAMEEVRLVAPSAGVTLTDEDVTEWLSLLDSLAEWGKTSMLQDVEGKRKTEVEVLAGSVIRIGEKLGVPTPVNRFLFDQIRAIEKMNGIG